MIVLYIIIFVIAVLLGFSIWYIFDLRRSVKFLLQSGQSNTNSIRNLLQSGQSNTESIKLILGCLNEFENLIKKEEKFNTNNDILH